MNVVCDKFLHLLRLDILNINLVLVGPMVRSKSLADPRGAPVTHPLGIQSLSFSFPFFFGNKFAK